MTDTADTLMRYERCPLAHQRSRTNPILTDAVRQDRAVTAALSAALRLAHDTGHEGALADSTAITTRALSTLALEWERHQLAPAGLNPLAEAVTWLLTERSIDPTTIVAIDETIGTTATSHLALAERTDGDIILITNWRAQARVLRAPELARTFRAGLAAGLARTHWDWVRGVMYAEWFLTPRATVRAVIDRTGSDFALARAEADLEAINAGDFDPVVGDHCNRCTQQPGCPALGEIPPEQLDF